MGTPYPPSSTTYDPALEEEIPVEEVNAAQPAPAAQSTVDAQAAADAAAAERDRQAMEQQAAAAEDVPVEEAPPQEPAPIETTQTSTSSTPRPADQSTIDYQAELDAKAAARDLAYTPKEPLPAVAYDPIVDPATGQYVADPRMAEQDRANWEYYSDSPTQTIEGRQQLERQGEQILQARQDAKYGLDEQGNPLPPVQDQPDQNILTRLTPFDEAKNAIVGQDGFSLGDLNPINVVGKGLVGMGQGLDKGRQRVVEAMGQEALDNIQKGRGETLPDESLADRIGGFLLNVPETLARLPLSKQSEDQIGDGGGYATWLNDPANADTILQIGTQGYNGYAGGRALWEYYVSDKTTAQRGLLDILIDPLTPITAGLGGVAKLGEGAAGASRAIGLAAKTANVVLDPLGEAVLPAAGKALRATPIPDAVENSPVGKLFQPSQTTMAEETLTSTAETLLGALEDADANPPVNVTALLPNAAQAAPAPGQALPNVTQTAPAAPTGRALTPLEAAAPPGIFPERNAQGVLTGNLIDLANGAVRPLNPAVDFPAILERMKVVNPYEYVSMRDEWFPQMFRGGTPGMPQFIDVYRPSSGAAYDNAIDLMASRVRLWGPDAYDDMFRVWVEDNATNQRWRFAYDGIGTWQNVIQHSGVDDPNWQLRMPVVQQVIDEATRRTLPFQTWDPQRLAGRPLPPIRAIPPTPAAAAPGVPAGAAPAAAPGLTPQQVLARTTTPGLATWRDQLTGALNNAVDPNVTQTLDRIVSGQSLGDRVFQLRQQLLDGQQRAAAGGTIDTDPILAALDQRLDGMISVEDLGRLDRRGINRVAALRASLDQMGDDAFKRQYPKFFERNRAVDPFSARGVVRGLTQELPAAVLYNPARILPFTAQQLLGNTTTAGVAGQLGAVPKMWNMRNNLDIFKRTRQGLAGSVESDFDRIVRTAGLPISDTFRMGGPAGEQSATLQRQLQKSSIYQKMGQVIAPQALRDFGGVSDLALREAVGTRELVRLAADARVKVRGNAAEWAQRMGVQVTPAQLDAAVQAVEDAARRESGQPIFSAPTLRAALEGSGAQGQDVAKWADRVARDYQSGLKGAYQGAKQETERIGFSFRKTNADEALGKVVFFTYWNLRASNLYARSLMKNPALLASYSRGVEGLNREAEDNNYPDYLKGWLRYMSDGGINAYFDPRKSFTTMVTLADQSFKSPDGDLNRLTALGRLQDGLPGMVNPVLGSFLYAIGALGADAMVPDPTGTGAIFRTGYDLTNKIVTMMGGEPLNPVLRAPVQGFVNTLASGISNATAEWFPDLQRVERKNPSAQWESRVNWMTQEVIREDHPDWSEEQVLAEAANVLGDLESPYVQEAIDRAASMPLAGPGYEIPGVGGLIGGLTANALGIIPRPEEQDTNLQRRQIYQQDPPGIDPVLGRPLNKDESKQIYLARDIAQSAGPQDIAFERAVDGFYNLATPAQTQIKDTYNSIRYQGVLPGASIKAAGRTWTADDVARMDPDQRGQLAELYLREQGDWEEYQRYKDAQELYKQQHPELREYFAFKETVEQYPGGPERWAEVTRASNPNLDNYIRNQEKLGKKNLPGGDGRVDMLTDKDAYRAAYGIPTSLYDVPLPPGDTGYFVAGVPTGLTPTQASELGSSGEQQGSGSTYNEETTQQLQDDLANYFGMVAIMDAYDAQVGNAPGTTQRQYVLRVATGDKGYKIPSPVYNQIKDAYGYVLPSKGKLGDYLGWALNEQANPEASTDIQDFLDWDRGQYLQRELAKPQPAAGQPVDVTGGLRAAPVGQQQKVVTMRAAAPGLADPKNQWSALLDVPPMLPLEPLSGYWVGPDRNWQLVQLPDGTQVWVDAALLTAA